MTTLKDPKVTLVELGGALDATKAERQELSEEAFARLEEILEAPSAPTVGLLKLMGKKAPTVH